MQVNWAYTHTHSHTCPQQCSWHPLTIRNWFGTSFCGRSCRYECECECECECFVLHRYYAWPDSLFQFIVRCFASGVALQIKTKKETDSSIAEQEMEKEEQKDAPCRALLHMQMQHVKLSFCINTLISSLPTPLPPKAPVHPPFAWFFWESTLFLTLRQLWLMDWLADQTSDKLNWTVDQLTIWPSDQLNRLTERWQIDAALTVRRCQSCPVPFYMSFRSFCIRSLDFS